MITEWATVHTVQDLTLPRLPRLSCVETRAPITRVTALPMRAMLSLNLSLFYPELPRDGKHHRFGYIFLFSH